MAGTSRSGRDWSMTRVLMAWFLAVATIGAALDGPARVKQRVTFESSHLRLVGFLYRPSGQGPFPAVIWNHGSERNPGTGPQFDAVADVSVRPATSCSRP